MIVNLRAYPAEGVEPAAAQLRFLSRALGAGAAERMQSTFPEGYAFTWALTGLAAAQLALELPVPDERRAEALDLAHAAVTHVESDFARSTFVEDLDPPHGAFYASWSLYLRVLTLRAGGSTSASSALSDGVERDCDRFAAALRRSESPFLPSYPGQVWPADTAVGVAALAVRDRLGEPRHRQVREEWVRKARSRVEPRLGLLPHRVHPGARDEARGSSLALMSRVLVDVDPEFARAQYAGLRQHFMVYRWGVPGVREYASGVEGRGDIDSGPLLLGFSGPATVVAAAAARAHGDADASRALLGFVEVAGLPVELSGRRRYAAGLVPVGDAFLAWARTTPTAASTPAFEPAFPRTWALPLHTVSLIAVLLLVAWIRPWRRRR